MNAIHIDTKPANIVEMMTRGQFHSHPDGRWRYSPYGAETVHVNDPTEHFEPRVDFAKGWGAATCKGHGIFALFYGDGTRSLNKWDERSFTRLWHLYAPRHDGERDQRAHIEAAFLRPVSA